MRRIAAAALVVGLALVAAAFATAGGGGEVAPPATVADQVPRGLAVWVEQGCGSCHAFAPANAHGTMAPDLSLSLDGRDEAYIRTSIVAPDAAAAPGWERGMMPPDFAQRIAPDDLDALVDLLASG